MVRWCIIGIRIISVILKNIGMVISNLSRFIFVGMCLILLFVIWLDSVLMLLDCFRIVLRMVLSLMMIVMKLRMFVMLFWIDVIIVFGLRLRVNFVKSVIRRSVKKVGIFVCRISFSKLVMVVVRIRIM